jgi:tetratricopeptide (TPR) repeat protein
MTIVSVRFAAWPCLVLAALVVTAAAATAPGEEPAAAAPKDAAATATAEPAAGTTPAPEADGDQPGHRFLDDAITAKLEINELDDFGRVLDLCKRALDKGLDADSKKFAEDLYTGTLIDRGAMLVGAILDADEPDPQWRRIRSFAMRDLNEVVARDPTIGGVHLMIARLEALPGGNRQRAAAEATKALDLLGDDQLQRAQANLVLASLEEDPDKQLRFFDAAVELAPRDVRVRRARGLHLLMHDDFAKARTDLLVAVEEDPDDPALQEALGMACMMGERLEEARAAFDRAIELDPDAIGPLLQRSRVFAVEGQRDKALADVDRVVEMAPRDQTARLLRARILQQAGETDLALTDVEAVLEQDGDAPAALELKGLIAAEREDYPEAIRSFRRLVAKNPDDPVLLGQLGMLFLAAKQPREAIRRFTKALEIDADSFPSRRGRSDAEITIGDHKAALADLEKALALKPEESGVLNNLAWLLATSPDDDLRDADRAIELAKKACEITEWKEGHIISTLAAGYAEKKYSRQAVATGEPAAEVRKQLEAELASYEAGKPWRERQELTEGGETKAGAAGDGGKPEGNASRDTKPRRPFDE